MAQSKIVGTAVIKKNVGGTVVVNIPLVSAGAGTLFLESKDIDFGEPNRDKYLDMLVFDIESDGSVPTLAITIGYRNTLKDAVVWTDAEYLDLDNPIIKRRLEARFFKIRLEDENPASQWKLSKVEAYGRLMGLGRM